MACCHRGGLHECLVRAAPPDLTSLAACFGPLQPRRPVVPSRPPLAGCRPRKSQLTLAQRLAPLPRCVAPRPPLAISRTMTTLTCAAVAGLWRASGPGAAVGRLCCQPAASAASVGFLGPLRRTTSSRPSGTRSWRSGRTPRHSSGFAQTFPAMRDFSAFGIGLFRRRGRGRRRGSDAK